MKQKDGSLKPAYQGSDSQQTGHWCDRPLPPTHTHGPAPSLTHHLARDPVLQRYVSCHETAAVWSCILLKVAVISVVDR